MASKEQFSAAVKCELLALSSHKFFFFFSIYFGLDWFPCRWTRSKCYFYRIPFCSYLAAGMQFRNLAYSFRISEIPVDVVVVQGCKAVWRKMKKLHVPKPRDSYFQRIADSSRGSYDSCVRCVDCEHTRMNCGSTYFCCKNCYSIGLPAVTATNCKFIDLCVGSFWTNIDAEAQWPPLGEKKL